MEEDLNRFRHILADATGAVESHYFLLPVADTQGGDPLLQYRERVYAYELYHQLRRRWPDWKYSLAGEVDKQGHPIVRGPDLDGAKPDLLVHVPGKMNQNLAAIEIKAVRDGGNILNFDAIKDDLKKLVAFRRGARYAAVFLIIFGERIERVIKYGQRCAAGGIEIGLVELYHHARPGERARRCAWY